MEITLNSKTINIDNDINIKDLLSLKGYENKMIAVAINGEFIPKSCHKAHVIKDRDEIEIVAPMQGG